MIYINQKPVVQVIATISPKINNVETLTEMIRAGMAVARLNFSHGQLDGKDGWRDMVRNLRLASEKAGKPIQILGDLQGPKIRFAKDVENDTSLKIGDIIVLTCESPSDNAKRRYCVPHPEFIDAIDVNALVKMTDGEVHGVVKAVHPGELTVVITHAGLIGSAKGVSCPTANRSVKAITPHDMSVMKQILGETGLDLDILDLSFVNSKEDILKARRLVTDFCGSAKVPLIGAKIETEEGVRNIKSIALLSDLVMVGRGDLATESINRYDVPNFLEIIIELCVRHAIPVIHATGLLESLEYKLEPSRAEMDNVRTSIKQGASYVMLSNETATGIDSVNAVRTLSEMAEHYAPHSALLHQRNAATSGALKYLPYSIRPNNVS